MDKLSFLIGPKSWQPMVDPAINGQSFIEIVREVEIPFAIKHDVAEIAGQYSGIPQRVALTPSRHLLGESDEFHRLIFSEGTSVLLVCTCGEPGCWALGAKIEVTENEVIWHDFTHNHRSYSPRVWSYEALGPFRFDKQQYIQALQTVPVIKSPAAERQEREQEQRRQERERELAEGRAKWQALASRIGDIQRLLPTPLHESPGANLNLASRRLKQHENEPDGRALYWTLETPLRLGQNNECAEEFWQEMLSVGEAFIASPPTRPL